MHPGKGSNRTLEILPTLQEPRGIPNATRPIKLSCFEPLDDLEIGFGKHDVKKKRRALTLDEAERLLEVASLRPRAEYGRPSTKLPTTSPKRTSWKLEPITFETLDENVERARRKFWIGILR